MYACVRERERELRKTFTGRQGIFPGPLKHKGNNIVRYLITILLNIQLYNTHTHTVAYLCRNIVYWTLISTVITSLYNKGLNIL